MTRRAATSVADAGRCRRCLTARSGRSSAPSPLGRRGLYPEGARYPSIEGYIDFLAWARGAYRTDHVMTLHNYALVEGWRVGRELLAAYMTGRYNTPGDPAGRRAHGRFAGRGTRLVTNSRRSVWMIRRMNELTPLRLSDRTASRTQPSAAAGSISRTGRKPRGTGLPPRIELPRRRPSGRTRSSCRRPPGPTLPRSRFAVPPEAVPWCSSHPPSG